MPARLVKALTNPPALVRHVAYLCRSARRWLTPAQPTEVTRDGERYYRYRGSEYPAYLNDGNAASHIQDKALEHCTGRGIDVGPYKWPFPGATPVENEPGCNAYELDSVDDGSLDYVFSSHCLEHLDRWQEALRLWVRKLKPGGILFLYLPHKSMKLWRPGSPWVGDQHKWVPTAKKVVGLLKKLGVEIVECQEEPDKYWSFHVVGRKNGG